MGLENADFIPEMVDTNPLGTDPKSEGDDHLQLIKRCVQNSFPSFTGTQASPAAVTLTEDEINDAALKSAIQTILAEWTFADGIKLSPSASILKGGSINLISQNASNFCEVGADNTRTQIKASDVVDCLIGVSALHATRATTPVLGGLLIADPGGTLRKTGFRNPGFTQPASPYTFQQGDEGQVIYKVSASAETWTVPILEAGTCITFLNRSQFTQTLVESGVTLVAELGGSGLLSPISVANNSIIQLYWLQSGTCVVWGNGLS